MGQSVILVVFLSGVSPESPVFAEFPRNMQPSMLFNAVPATFFV
ncbi:Uncharacterized protein YR821_1303 [Yersinia ruckeri]|uniref:Uncharacterized protein n=1 Tax=Yersinia ruckeri TaxID=29486 RepID=A0A0A8VBL2_YERRU|nr:hypothetical protein yruck0001_20180 [Yersinia ruckeri ATCC 29473]QTD76231.1 Uncharacterized protein YR821_1303 [Yersinia ruckeri]CEK27132.1 hypothetical protein CSF007_6875 [Yersinia ruckeri]